MFNNLNCTVKYNEIMAPYTSWKIGGPCDTYILPNNIDDIITVKEICTKNKIPLFILGNGSNVLIDDSGVRGTILHLGKMLSSIEFNNNTITVGAGFSLPRLAFFLAKKGVGGLDFYASIPGTVGGAVAMNAGSDSRDTSQVLKAVTYINDTGTLVKEKVEDINYSYRYSKFLDSPSIIVSATYKYVREDPNIALYKTKQIAARRRLKFPLHLPTAGSTFKSPPNGPFPGKLIEGAGLKGLRVGGAMISKHHGNWIENVGGATAQDVLMLVSHIKKVVKEKYGVVLIEEFIKIK